MPDAAPRPAPSNLGPPISSSVPAKTATAIQGAEGTSPEPAPPKTTSCLGVPHISCSYNVHDPHHLITFGEFLGVIGLLLALRALARPAMNFRLRVAGISNVHMLGVLAAAGVFVLIGSLLPLYDGPRSPIIGYSIAWELLAALLSFLGMLYLLYVAFGAARFAARNARRYYDASNFMVATGDEAALSELATDIYVAVPGVIRACKEVPIEREGPAQVRERVVIAYRTLDLWSDERLCAAMVIRAPETAIELLHQIASDLSPSQGGRSCVHQIVDQALTLEGSILYREDEFSPLGRQRTFTRAIASNYRFVEDFRPLQAWDWRHKERADAHQVDKYGALVLAALEAYLAAGDFGSNPAALWSAFRELAELAPSRAWRLRRVDEAALGGGNADSSVLYSVSSTFRKIIEIVTRNDSLLAQVTTALPPDGRDHTIFGAVAEGVFRYLQGLAQVLSHDEVVRMAAIEIWMELFPSDGSEPNRAGGAIGLRLIERLKSKVEDNLGARFGGYPLVTRVLLTFVGFPTPESPRPHGSRAEKAFYEWLFNALKTRYAMVAKHSAERARELLPATIRFHGLRLEQSRYGGNPVALELAPAE